MDASLMECTFLVPTRRDINLSDGEEHDPEIWEWLNDELFDRFDGASYSPLPQSGFYRDPDTQERVSDESRRITVAVHEAQLEELRKLLSAACVFFQQKCIYLSVAGRVEFIHYLNDDPI